MHTFLVIPVHDDPPSFEVQGETWTHALAEALLALRLQDEHADCDVQPNGSIRVQVQAGDGKEHAFELRDRAASEPVGVRLADVPLDLSYLPEDSPAPMDAPAWRTYVASGESALAHVAERCDALAREPDTGRYIEAMLDLLMEVVPAQSAAILLVDDAGQPGGPSRDLRFASARGPRAHGLRGVCVPAGRGIAGLTVRAGIALTVREATVDPRHYREVDERTGYRTHAILSVPIRLPAETGASGTRQARGCVQLLNPLAGTVFVPWHQTAAQTVGSRLAERLAAAER
jgi:hypothetical protein